MHMLWPSRGRSQQPRPAFLGWQKRRQSTKSRFSFHRYLFSGAPVSQMALLYIFSKESIQTEYILKLSWFACVGDLMMLGVKLLISLARDLQSVCPRPKWVGTSTSLCLYVQGIHPFARKAIALCWVVTCRCGAFTQNSLPIERAGHVVL